MIYLFVGLFLVAAGGFTLPIEQLPETRAATVRALFGCLMLIAGGASLAFLFRVGCS